MGAVRAHIPVPKTAWRSFALGLTPCPCLPCPSAKWFSSIRYGVPGTRFDPDHRGILLPGKWRDQPNRPADGRSFGASRDLAGSTATAHVTHLRYVRNAPASRGVDAGPAPSAHCL